MDLLEYSSAGFQGIILKRSQRGMVGGVRNEFSFVAEGGVSDGGNLHGSKQYGAEPRRRRILRIPERQEYYSAEIKRLGGMGGSAKKMRGFSKQRGRGEDGQGGFSRGVNGIGRERTTRGPAPASQKCT